MSWHTKKLSLSTIQYMVCFPSLLSDGFHLGIASEQEGQSYHMRYMATSLGRTAALATLSYVRPLALGNKGYGAIATTVCMDMIAIFSVVSGICTGCLLTSNINDNITCMRAVQIS